MKKKILVIAAHPDDETLGCGGTISKFTKEGNLAKVVFLSDGVSSRDEKKNSQKKIKIRNNQALSACKILGIKKIIFYDYPDNALDTISLLKITKSIEKQIFEFKPNIIFTHNSDDLNIDHRIVSEATIIATRFYKLKHEILSYEVLSSTDLNFHKSANNFKPNYFVDIKNEIKKKIQALKKYNKEIRKFPHPRSEKGVKVLSNYRGMFAGLEYAEAFKLIKKIY